MIMRNIYKLEYIALHPSRQLRMMFLGEPSLFAHDQPLWLLSVYVQPNTLYLRLRQVGWKDKPRLLKGTRCVVAVDQQRTKRYEEKDHANEHREQAHLDRYRKCEILSGRMPMFGGDAMDSDEPNWCRTRHAHHAFACERNC